MLQSYHIIPLLFSVVFTIEIVNAQQGSIVVYDNQTVIIMNGRATDMSCPDQYIYRNDVDTAYALVVGNYYSQEEVERALGKPDSIENQVEYSGEYNQFGDGNMMYYYKNLYLNFDYNYGLYEFINTNKNITFVMSPITIKLGNSFRELEEKYPNPVICKEFGTRKIDDRNRITALNVSINFTGEDNYLLLGLDVNYDNGIELFYNSIQYIQNN